MTRHDLIVLGAGSGNVVINDAFDGLDVAIVTEGPFGGTCLNCGCIPSKMLAYTAEVAGIVAGAGRYGVDAELAGVRWRAVRDRVFERLDRHSAESRDGRDESDFITVYDGTARFTGPRRLRVDRQDGGPVDLEADQIVVATGSRPVVPKPVRDSGLPFETSDTVMRMDELPRRLVVLGGGYVAAELATVFAAFGAEVTLVEREPQLLTGHDESVSSAFTELAGRRFDLRLDTDLTGVAGSPGDLRFSLDDGSELSADVLLVAAGRIPNGDRLDLDAAGIAVHDDGRIRVDEYQRTTAEGVFALGDACTPIPLKHVANHEARVVSHNLRHPGDLRSAGDRPVPAAVFTQPQIASIGRTEEECREAGLDYVVGTARYADVAYGWALEDETGFCKVLAEPDTGKLLGAHLLGPQAATLVQPLVLAMTLGLDARTVAETPYWIHPALTEVVENALLDLR